MAEIKKYTVTEPYLKIDCALGESPFWEESTNTLRFVDVVKRQIHTIGLNVGPSSHQVLAELDISIGTTADIEGNDDGDFVFAGKHGFGIFYRKTKTYKYIKKVWTDEEAAQGKEHEMRFNDGGVDSEGRFWAGAMNDQLVKAPTNEGFLFRLDPDLSLHRVLSNVTIPNGISWNKANDTLYYADSPSKNIYAYSFDPATGTISDERIFYTVPEKAGVPDGHVIDEEGYMWSAVHGTGKVIRISPEGKRVAEISLPTRCVTCPCFVGEDLFITSMEDEEPDKYPDSLKYQGSVFRCHVGVRGVKPNKLKYRAE